MSIISIETVLPAPSRAVYDCFANSGLMRVWFSDGAHTDPRVGGHWHAYWNNGSWVSGIYSVVEEGHALSFTWCGSGDLAPTQVELNFTEDDGGTLLRIVHHQGAGEGWMEAAAGRERAWEAALVNLRYLLQTGIDRRFALRPMFGFFVGDNDKERAEKLGVPIHHGVVVDGLPEGSPMARAGFQVGDVIVQIGSIEVKDYYAIGRIADTHQAGDTVPVSFYRGPDHKMVELTLAQRPLPPLPDSVGGVVAQLQRTASELGGELDEMIGQLPETVLAHRPGEKEWSITDQLAHLIMSDRSLGWQMWALCGGDGNGTWGGNNEMHLAGLKRVYPTGAEMLAALKRTFQELIGTVEAMPQDAQNNPALFKNAAYILSYFGQHTRSHYDQMRACIESAHAMHVA
ncbi:MAG: SRPBCC domain-containing protein [Chloroflexi bacterium]|nr:SRPBCC domain-containing protein [Chloroflexota bacterium]